MEIFVMVFLYRYFKWNWRRIFNSQI